MPRRPNHQYTEPLRRDGSEFTDHRTMAPIVIRETLAGKTDDRRVGDRVGRPDHALHWTDTRNYPRSKEFQNLATRRPTVRVTGSDIAARLTTPVMP